MNSVQLSYNKIIRSQPKKRINKQGSVPSSLSFSDAQQQKIFDEYNNFNQEYEQRIKNRSNSSVNADISFLTKQPKIVTKQIGSALKVQVPKNIVSSSIDYLPRKDVDLNKSSIKLPAVFGATKPITSQFKSLASQKIPKLTKVKNVDEPFSSNVYLDQSYEINSQQQPITPSTNGFSSKEMVSYSSTRMPQVQIKPLSKQNLRQFSLNPLPTQAIVIKAIV